MAEFEHINGYPVKDKKARFYNNVAEMKSIEDLQAGDIISTIGYYEANDGGAATYKIREKEESDVEDLGSIHFINEFLVAEMMINKNEVNILQFGAKGDGITNDTTAFNNALNKAKVVYVPELENPYLLDYLSLPENKQIIGIGKPQINVYRNTNTIMSCIRTNCVMENLYINSLDENLEWNRFAIQDCNNVLIKNCKFEGYRHNSDKPNAWGNYLKACSNIRIIDCEYDNNTQSDIAIVDSVENVIIENCKGINETFHINFEPNEMLINKNIVVNKCNMSRLQLLENTFNVHSLDNITIQNCVIDLLVYRGAKVNFINSKIKDIESKPGISGIINNINTFGYYENINNDPTFKKIVASNTSNVDTFKNWITGYATEQNVLKAIYNEKKGRCLEINPNQSKTVGSIYKDFAVTPSKLYAIRTLMNTKTGEVINHSGHALRIRCFDSSENQIGDSISVCIDRNNTVNNESEWNEKIVLIKAPELCTKIRVWIGNTNIDTSSYCKATFKYLLFNEINLNSIDDNKDFETYSDSVNTSKLNLFNEQNQSLKGDKIYCENSDITGCEGYICVASGNPGSWKKFGVIADI